jgi:hypothetical protein
MVSEIVFVLYYQAYKYVKQIFGVEVDKLTNWNHTYIGLESSLEPKFVMCEGEHIVRKYRATSSDFPSIAGTLFVTTRRILFQGEGSQFGGSSMLISEVPIGDVAGVSTFIGKGLNIVKLIVAIILAVIFLVMTKSIWFPLVILLLIPAYMIYSALTGSRRLGLIIYAKGVQPSPIQLLAETDFRAKLTGQYASLAMFAAPGVDAAKMATEVGALILDLQSMGDMAIEKWKDSQA